MSSKNSLTGIKLSNLSAHRITEEGEGSPDTENSPKKRSGTTQSSQSKLVNPNRRQTISPNIKGKHLNVKVHGAYREESPSSMNSPSPNKKSASSALGRKTMVYKPK